MAAARIPKCPPFKGDYSESFDTWEQRFVVHLDALNVNDDQRRNVLMCLLSSAAFGVASEHIAQNADATYDEVVEALREIYAGEQYRRTLETKFRNLVFTPGTHLQDFAHRIKTTIRELYNVQEDNAVQAIAVNQVLMNVSDEIRDRVRMLQIAGTQNLIPILEIIETSFKTSPRKPPQEQLSKQPQVAAAAADSHSRLERLEGLIEKLVKNQINTSQPSGRSQNKQCRVCRRPHDEKECWILHSELHPRNRAPQMQHNAVSCFNCGGPHY